MEEVYIINKHILQLMIQHLEEIVLHASTELLLKLDQNGRPQTASH